MIDAEIAAEEITAGEARLGIELGSTRIKACLVNAAGQVLATGAHEWSTTFDGNHWTYGLTEVWSGVQAAYADLVAATRRTYGVSPKRVAALGVSAMMHGYLVLDEADELLVPFRTWRNTNTGVAAATLTELFGLNVPLRWSIAHLGQAMLDREPHVPRIAFMTTLAGYVHWRLSGERVLGIGDASGLFPIAEGGREYDSRMIREFDVFADELGQPEERASVELILPRVLLAGEPGGTLTDAGAKLLDPSGELAAGSPLCPPEGDAGTGMVATGAVRPRTGNVSVGTSVFAMVVLEHRTTEVHSEIDLVATPDGSDVAMVHCNNGASELADWVKLFVRFAQVAGLDIEPDRAFAVLLSEAMSKPSDQAGLLALNIVAGEPVLNLTEGLPALVRKPGTPLSLAGTTRAQLDAVFAALAVGMRTLAKQGIAVDQLVAHGGVFRTPGAAELVLAQALDTEIVIPNAAPEGGAWGMALLASYMVDGHGRSLAVYLDNVVLQAGSQRSAVASSEQVAAYGEYLKRYQRGVDAILMLQNSHKENLS